MNNFRKPLKWFPLWFVIGCCLVGLVVYLSLTSNPVPMPRIEFGDKVGHCLAYFTLVFWFAQLYLPKRHGHFFVLFVLMGVLLEVVQAQTSYRTFQYADMLANTSGALLAWLLAKSRFSELLLLVEQHFIKR